MIRASLGRFALLLSVAALLGALLLHGSAPAVEAQALEKPDAAQLVRLHLGAYLFWHESSGADGYEIQTRSQSGGTWGTWSSISYTGTTQPATVTGLTSGTRYQWRIRATSGSEQSEWSAHDDVSDLAYNWTAESLGRNIANPAVLQSAEPADPGEVTVTWTHGPARSGVTITGWTVGYRLFSEPVNQIRQTSLLAASATMATVTGLTGGEQYEFWVRPYVGGYPGRTSNALEATPTTTSTPIATPVPTQSSDATLRALSVSAGSISPAFSSTTYAYTLSVASGVATTTVTPTVNHSAATVTVNGTTVASGSPSGSIPLNVGANTITVRVTAENGAATQDYTVTITRQSRDADLSALVASAATSESATYSPQTLTPAFAAGTTSYAATVVNAMTHAKVTPTVNHSAATVTVNGTMVASGTASAAIALNVGANAITVRVTAEDTSFTRNYTVTITRQARNAVEGSPPAPSGLTVTPCPHCLSVTWTAPGGTVDGYDVHYTTVVAEDLADDAEVGYYQHPRVGRIINRHPGRGWVTLPNTTKEPKYGMGYLQPGQEYRVRVRAYNSDGAGPWAVGKGTPLQARRTVSLSASAERVREGGAVTITATVKYNGRATPIQEDMDILLSTHLGTAEAGDVGTLERISIGKYTARGSATIQTHRDGDNDDETFAVLIHSIPKRDLARAGDPAIVWVTIAEGDPAPPAPVVLVPELRASGGDGALHLSWSDSSSEHAGYDVQYKRSSAADRPATTAGDPATGWVDAGHTGLERSATITGLTNRVSYDARVRLAFPDGTGRWSAVVSRTVTMPTPEQGQAPTVSGSGDAPPEQEAVAQPTSVTLSPDASTVSESAGTVTVTATLDAPAPEGGIGGFLFAGADGTASQDIDFTMPLEIFIRGGERSATATISITDDDLDESHETVVISALFDLGAAVLEDTITLTITDDDTAGTVEDTFTVTVKTAPTVALAIGDIPDLAAGDTRDVSLSGVFSDLDGDALTITAGSSSDGVATVVVSADQSRLTLTGVAEGTATITVTAEDADGNRVSDAFDVTVAAPQSPLTGIAARYDTNGDGAIDGSEYQQVKNDWLSDQISYDEFLEVVRVHLSSD